MIFNSEQEFVDYIGPKATQNQVKYGILASITIAQACLESGYGSTDLALNANNFFGMKTTLSNNTWRSVWDGVSKYTKITNEEYTVGVITKVQADFRSYPSMDKSIEDHALYLKQAKNGNFPRYPGLTTEKDYHKAAQIIKDGGYATASNYVEKLCELIERWNLTQYDWKVGTKVNMNINVNYLTKCPCFADTRTNSQKGIMLHSIGTPQPKAKSVMDYWNQASNTNACVHAIIDGNTGEVYQLLPWNKRAWHCGKGTAGISGNDTHMSVEMCEPSCIKYMGGATFTCSDIEAAKTVAIRTYEAAVELFAQLCLQFSLNPLADGVVISHAEGYRRGLASNHGDPEHLWRQLGLPYTMDTFRQAVANKMNTKKVAVDIRQFPKVPFSAEILIDDLNYRSVGTMSGKVLGIAKKGACVINNVNAYGWGELSTGGWIYLRNPSYVKIGQHIESIKYPATPFQIKVLINDLNYRTAPDTVVGSEVKGQTGKGTFTISERNGDWGKLVGNGYWIYLKNPNYVVIGSTIAANTEYMVRVTADSLNIRKGPNVSYPVVGAINDKGSYTIVKEQNGWGLLKSYAKNENGWINLAYTVR